MREINLPDGTYDGAINSDGTLTITHAGSEHCVRIGVRAQGDDIVCTVVVSNGFVSGIGTVSGSAAIGALVSI